MMLQRFSIIALAASAAVAVPDVQKRQSYDNAEIVSLAAEFGITTLPTNPAALSSLESAVKQLTAILPPPSILSVLETAVPASVISDLSDPASASVFASEFAGGSTPGWYSSLPSDVKNFFSTFSPTLQTMAASSAESYLSDVKASESSEASTAAASATSTASSTSASPSSSISSTSASATATSTGGAPKPTGTLLASFVGIIGVFGLAVML